MTRCPNCGAPQQPSTCGYCRHQVTPAAVGLMGVTDRLANLPSVSFLTVNERRSAGLARLLYGGDTNMYRHRPQPSQPVSPYRAARL